MSAHGTCFSMLQSEVSIADPQLAAASKSDLKPDTTGHAAIESSTSCAMKP